jgi:hypothetical protein
MDENNPTPRLQRTPTTEANDLLDDLKRLWVSACPEGTEEAFETKVIDPLIQLDGVDGEDFERYFAELQIGSNMEIALWPLIDLPITIACAHAINASYADSAGAVNLAWTYVQDASFWHGISFALAKVAEDSPAKSISEVARKAANKKNEENRAMKLDAFSWLEANFEANRFTIDDAAERLGKVVPMKFSTRRSYVIEWKASR